MKKAHVIIASILLISFTVALALTYAGIGANKKINASGSITHSANLGVYSDSACTLPLTTADWGDIYPGTKAMHTIYVKNTGSISLALSITLSNWSPTSANGPLTITWNKEGANLPPGQSTPVTLTLRVLSSVDIKNFSVQINIAGTLP